MCVGINEAAAGTSSMSRMCHALDVDDNAQSRRQLEHVFPDARGHAANWPQSHWHSAVEQPHSSQALCVSVWGTLAAHRQRARIVSEVFEAAGLDLGPLRGPSIRCEAGAGGELATLLNETGGNATPTCVDALVEWAGGVVAVESKFTEPSFGACGQTQPRTDRPPGAKGTVLKLAAACSGRYGTGSDQKTGTRAPCRLQTWDGDRAPRLYWQIAWEAFAPEVLVPDGRPCPFAEPAFQLMRNLLLARAKASPHARRIDRAQAPIVAQREWGLLVAHVEGHPNAAAHRREVEEFRDLLLDDVRRRVGIVSYEQIVPILREHRLDGLADDVERRIVLAPRR